MDFVKNLTGGDKDNGGASQQSQERRDGESGQEKKEGGGFLGGIGDKLNSAAGGGRESEKNEDYLDKGQLSSSQANVKPLYNGQSLPPTSMHVLRLMLNLK